MGLVDKLRSGLRRSREVLNEVFYFGGEVNEDFWENLEDTLILGDLGVDVTTRVVGDLREEAARKNLRTARELEQALVDALAETFPTSENDPFSCAPMCVLFVGINGSGKTTTVGKIAGAAREAGRQVIIGGADTFRAAAIEQLEVWGKRADVRIVTRSRGADPASVCYDTLAAAEDEQADLVLIDTAGRLHTSPELMRELAKVVDVTRKRASCPVSVVLVLDATTGQNGLVQAQEFNDALGLDGLIITKLDGTAKGGIAVHVASKLKVPIYRVGVGEGIDDLQLFDAYEFAAALVGSSDKN